MQLYYRKSLLLAKMVGTIHNDNIVHDQVHGGNSGGLQPPYNYSPPLSIIYTLVNIRHASNADWQIS